MSKRDVKGKVTPEVMQTILLDELCGRMDDLSIKFDKLNAFITFMGPMTRMFKREWQYQYATVAAGAKAQIYLIQNPQPSVLVGIITQVGNSWYHDTFLEWITDGDVKKVEYVIADVKVPKHYERGIPFQDKVQWIAYNNDVNAHVFEVLCDGFFIPKTVYDQIVHKEA